MWLRFINGICIIYWLMLGVIFLRLKQDEIYRSVLIPESLQKDLYILFFVFTYLMLITMQ